MPIESRAERHEPMNPQPPEPQSSVNDPVERVQSELLPIPEKTAPDPDQKADHSDELGLRLNRREIQLLRCLDNLAETCDDDVPLFWFRRVFKGWIKPQSEDRKARIRFVLQSALESI